MYLLPLVSQIDRSRKDKRVKTIAQKQNTRQRQPDSDTVRRCSYYIHIHTRTTHFKMSFETDDQSSVPCISLHDFEQRRADIIEQLMDASTRIGFL